MMYNVRPDRGKPTQELFTYQSVSPTAREGSGPSPKNHKNVACQIIRSGSAESCAYEMHSAYIK